MLKRYVLSVSTTLGVALSIVLALSLVACSGVDPRLDEHLKKADSLYAVVIIHYVSLSDRLESKNEKDALEYDFSSIKGIMVLAREFVTNPGAHSREEIDKFYRGLKPLCAKFPEDDPTPKFRNPDNKYVEVYRGARAEWVKAMKELADAYK